MNDENVSLHAPEVRTFPGIEFRDFDTTPSGRFLEGRAVPYNTWTDVGWFQEQFLPGAFAKSIRESAKDIKLLAFHDNKRAGIGGVHEWRDNDDGLDCVWWIDTDDPFAMELARKAKIGLLTGLSVGFAPIEDDLEIDDLEMMWVTRKEARLLEVSLTPTPAYAGAKVELVRSRQKPAAGGRRRSAELDAWHSYLDGLQRL